MMAFRALAASCFALLLLAASPVRAGDAAAVVAAAQPGSVPLVAGGVPAAIMTDGTDAPGVLAAARNLQADLARVSGRPVRLVSAPDGAAPALVIVGTLGRSALVDRLVREGRLDVSGVAGQWEAYVHQVVDRPVAGVDRALVIAGADRRGTIFGIYDLSQRIGVSPWHWWADVPVARRDELHVLPGRRTDRPAVRYRGIFINDEDPALRGWAEMTFGGFNSRFYARVFELILRSRGNFLWPAMWGKSFHEDDPANARLADEMGVVIGTSHHEPLMRAHVDWEHHGEGPWDYARNAPRLRRFWREGLERTRGLEQLVTIGMRGDGDEPMTEGTATALLERIVADQRALIGEVSGRPAAETPQVWALYKEVQDYYDAGMEVPDDVTLLFADDNWGNIRRLPDPGAERPGGYGVYYHFDYVGGPRNYKWINTNQVERVWEQMQRAYAHGADRLWIVNVGDIKPMEYPISFFLDLAWDPPAMPLERLTDYPRMWAARQFGEAHAGEIGALLTDYARLAARRKPELLAPESYSLVHGETDRVLAEWQALEARAEALGRTLGPEYRDAYVQLVLHPILAFSNLHALYAAGARNRLYAAQGRAEANAWADEAERLFARDREIGRLYEEGIAGGRWRHMMAQTHIGYTGWQQPPEDVMPEVRRIEAPASAAMAVAVEGSDQAWPGGAGTPALPPLDRFGPPSRELEIFNRGTTPFELTATSSAPWLRLEPAPRRRPGPSSSSPSPSATGRITDGAILAVAIDWANAPAGRSTATIVLAGSDGTTVEVAVPIHNPSAIAGMAGFVESNGIVAIEAGRHARAVGDWAEIPHLGLTRSGMTPLPLAGPAWSPGGNSPRLEYPIHLFEAGEVELQVVLSPTLDYPGQGGLNYAVSIDDAPPQLVNVHAGTTDADWNRAVADNRWVRTTRHRIDRPGPHIIRLWAVDPGLVFQRLVLARGPLPQTYLGPRESRFVEARD